MSHMLDSNFRYKFLLVEDNVGDVLLTKRAVSRMASPVDLSVAIDGVDALSFLRKEGRYTQAPRPQLILLDLHLPRKDGRQVLREVKADADLRTIPIIILTTSSAPADIKNAYELHANGYLSKPVGFEGFVQMLDAVNHFWLTVAHLP